MSRYGPLARCPRREWCQYTVDMWGHHSFITENNDGQCSLPSTARSPQPPPPSPKKQWGCLEGKDGVGGTRLLDARCFFRGNAPFDVPSSAIRRVTLSHKASRRWQWHVCAPGPSYGKAVWCEGGWHCVDAAVCAVGVCVCVFGHRLVALWPQLPPFTVNRLERFRCMQSRTLTRFGSLTDKVKALCGGWWSVGF